MARTASRRSRKGCWAEWDTTGLDGLYALRLMVVRSDQRVDQAVVQVTLDNTPPQVAISYPQAGQTISAAQEPQVALQAQASDPFLKNVEFYMDGVLVGQSSLPPFGVVWASKAGNIHLGWWPHRPGWQYRRSQSQFHRGEVKTHRVGLYLFSPIIPCKLWGT